MEGLVCKARELRPYSTDKGALLQSFSSENHMIKSVFLREYSGKGTENRLKKRQQRRKTREETLQGWVGGGSGGGRGGAGGSVESQVLMA